MADTAVYTHHVEFKGSSVLQDAFYNERNYRLYITFLNGSVAGYTNVSKITFDNLTRAASAGHYYNLYIKGAYPTTHSDVVFVPESAQQAVGTAPVPNDKHEAFPDNGNEKSPQYVVTVHVTGELQFTVKAKDVKHAVDQIDSTLSKTLSSGDYSIEGVSRS